MEQQLQGLILAIAGFTLNSCPQIIHCLIILISFQLLQVYHKEVHTSSFTKPLTVTKIGSRMWRVDREFEYYVGHESSVEVVTVPKGFETDFASVPRLFWMLVPPDGKYTQAAVLHDFILSTNLYPQKKADRIFLEAMAVLRVPTWKRMLMYWSVRIWSYF